MASRSEGGLARIQEGLHSNATPKDCRANGQRALHISTSRKGLLSDKIPKRRGFFTFPTPGIFGLLMFGSATNLASPSSKFRKVANERDEESCSAPSSTSQGLRQPLGLVISNKLDWRSLVKMCKDYANDPFNAVLLLWIGCVAISGAILFLVMTGMLNSLLPKKSQRNAWFEVNNQILNALFTLMCLYQHPKRFHHLVLLCRWRLKDVSALRKVHCKGGTVKPRERIHMMVVFVLLHVNCFAQYALCGLNLGYKRSERPAIGVGVCLSVAIASPAIAGLYSILSPLGKEYITEVDEEAQDGDLTSSSAHPGELRRKSIEKRLSFASKNERRIIEHRPEWRGGFCNLCDNSAVAYLSLFCSFCIFGWNMERLGFGNMYVHIATFLLFCIAPFWIFGLAAINIDDEIVRKALGFTGIALCVFGLLYGGFWRIQMRKRFNLPADHFCCGKPAIADCVRWLFCCWCSLAQEVRTADFYDIVEDKFCRKQTQDCGQAMVSDLPCEDVAAQRESISCSPNPNSYGGLPGVGNLQSPGRYSNDTSNLEMQLAELVEESKLMKPPSTSSMKREGM
ncbi:uncharacterized protein J3R85_005257 [Psidium guajava]|nr:uncharacterized protein J3R85_005257 [Psidium guajava]